MSRNLQTLNDQAKITAIIYGSVFGVVSLFAILFGCWCFFIYQPRKRRLNGLNTPGMILGPAGAGDTSSPIALFVTQLPTNGRVLSSGPVQFVNAQQVPPRLPL